MPQSIAKVPTDLASRYLQQLCKHWSHRFDTRFDATEGRIDFGGGESLTLGAQDATLTLTVQSPTPEALAALETVVADHLQRFAFRDPLDIRWQAA